MGSATQQVSRVWLQWLEAYLRHKSAVASHKLPAATNAVGNASAGPPGSASGTSNNTTITCA